MTADTSALGGRVAARADELRSGRVPFVLATVVRAQSPTSTHAGDTALVLGDGSMDGFVGGQCAEGSVRTASLNVLERGEPLLLRIIPPGEEPSPDAPGSHTVTNPCLSGGALEIFLEPQLPTNVLAIVGSSPIAEAVDGLARALHFAVVRDGDGPARPDGAVAMVVASHGRAEEESIKAALGAGVGFVGLVASAKRGAAVLDGLALDAEERARVHTPVGLKIGARTPVEVALSIMAEVVRAVRVDGLAAAHGPGGPEGTPAAPVDIVQAVDPVCGMTVVVGPDTEHLEVDGQDHWFCCAGCRARFADRSAG